MKSATVYKRSDGWYFHSDSQTTAGVWIATPPFLKRSATESSMALGEAALVALNASCASVPHPIQWDGIFQPMFDLANVREWGQFTADAKCLGLEADGEWLTINPMLNEGSAE